MSISLFLSVIKKEIVFFYNHHCFSSCIKFCFNLFNSILYHRPRPFVALSIKNLLVENSYSFPSHHATFFFTMATVIYLYDKNWEEDFYCCFNYCLSRVVAGIHYPSDILGGMIIGILVGYLTSCLIKKLSL